MRNHSAHCPPSIFHLLAKVSLGCSALHITQVDRSFGDYHGTKMLLLQNHGGHPPAPSFELQKPISTVNYVSTASHADTANGANKANSDNIINKAKGGLWFTI